jgi:hypothetical protein
VFHQEGVPSAKPFVCFKFLQLETPGIPVKLYCSEGPKDSYGESPRENYFETTLKLP